jgi:hypothetical protein
MSVKTNSARLGRHKGCSKPTVTLLGEQKVCFARSREVGYTVTGVEKRRTLISWKLCVRADSQGFIMAKVTTR